MEALVKGADPLVKGGVVQWEMQWLDEPRLGTGCQAGTEQPIRGVKPGRSEGPREAEWIVSPLFWRARPVAVTSPRPPQPGGWRRRAREVA